MVAILTVEAGRNPVDYRFIGMMVAIALCLPLWMLLSSSTDIHYSLYSFFHDELGSHYLGTDIGDISQHHTWSGSRHSCCCPVDFNFSSIFGIPVSVRMEYRRGIPDLCRILPVVCRFRFQDGSGNKGKTLEDMTRLWWKLVQRNT